MSEERLRLEPSWENLYNAYRFQPNVSLNENTSRLHSSFNRYLKESLYHDQQNNYLPNRDQIVQRSTDLIEHLKEEIFEKGSRSFSIHEIARHVDLAISNANWTPIHTPEDQVQMIAVVDELEIPGDGSKWIQECLGASRDENFYQLIICLAEVPKEDMEINSYANKLAEIGLRRARNKMRLYVRENHNAFTGFHYPLLQRLEDWITLNVTG